MMRETGVGEIRQEPRRDSVAATPSLDELPPHNSNMNGMVALLRRSIILTQSPAVRANVHSESSDHPEPLTVGAKAAAL